MKTDRELVMLSIEHWKRIKDKCKELLDAGYFNYNSDYTYDFYERYIGESIKSEGCPLCSKYLPERIDGIQFCDCNYIWSAWLRTIQCKNTLDAFIRSIEGIMIPSLYECLKYCKDE